MNSGDAEQQPKGRLLLMLGALGVVFGDIGTSPLYAMRHCFLGGRGLPVTEANVLGILSLIVWAMILVLCVKYITIILRADNHGEGGSMALISLVQKALAGRRRRGQWLLMLGLVGTALLYGDGMITPAISVLSAVEGLTVATDFFQPYILPITLGILLALFAVQREGTGRVGVLFGPVLLLWFAVLAWLGLRSLVKAPDVLAAFDPRHGLRFLFHNGAGSFTALGGVFLVLTGAEALYADLGHFGKAPVRQSWFTVVFPALLLNYLGQGAHLLRAPQDAANLFYKLVPAPLLYPMVVLATAATVIASQALIAGAFSITRQAVQLGFWPRLTVIHTSRSLAGQVYLPIVNWVLFAGTAALVLGFRRSESLAAAYGVAVSADMLITTILVSAVAFYLWKTRLVLLLPIALFFGALDFGFLSANTLKLAGGGWVPLAVASLAFLLMRIWKKGRERLYRGLAHTTLEITSFLDDIQHRKPLRVPGVAVFLTGNPAGVPRTLLHNYKHNRVIHENTVMLTVRNEDVPTIPNSERASLVDVGQGLYRIVVRYGFSESPNLPAVLNRLSTDALDLTPQKTSFFLGRETLILGSRPGMAPWKKKLFALLARNALDATAFFKLPPNRVVELGIQVEL